MRQHKAILRAIESRDPLAAEKRMREHITEMEQLVFTSQGQAGESTRGATPPPLRSISGDSA
jgi:DNA-binding GntR family transcriptional regulator